ncbi:hypothetical protein [Oceanobacillus neutriphilus]|uniref:Uncharacterized protein n=1 Tax=Oceanobacillus neutriphilus TaxID=531815 RepID=A0ABQ2NMT7_9BACI|nr:hypothetical protein [Oceanobacillus neutriphilus]GGP07318.1 hypothetical protein GCM10011346_02830 [Oceanobacillus neutriphilus]
MTIEELLAKHAKNFIAEKDAPNYKPGLDGIQYNKNGCIYVVNGHVLLRIVGIMGREKTEIRHYKTGKVLDVKPWAFEKFFGDEFTGSFTINPIELKKYIPSIRAAYAIEKFGILRLKSDGVSIQAANIDNESFFLNLSDKFESDPYTIRSITLDLNYLADILEFFSDAEVDEVWISIPNGFKPILFKALNYEVLLMPCRRV